MNRYKLMDRIVKMLNPIARYQINKDPARRIPRWWARLVRWQYHNRWDFL